MIALIDEALEAYAARHATEPSPLLAELEQRTRENQPDHQMLVGGLEGAFLRLMVLVSGARRVLEVGTFTGYSALSMAEVLPEDGRIVTCDIDADTTAVAQAFFDRSPHGHKIEIRLGPALETIAALDDPVDLVFLDADKESYVNYYDAVVPLMRPGALLIADNVLWSGAVLDPKHETDYGLVAFNDTVQCDPRVDNVLLTIRDGVMLARKRP